MLCTVTQLCRRSKWIWTTLERSLGELDGFGGTASGEAGGDEQVEETVERMLSEGDIEGDGVISEELKQVMRMPCQRVGIRSSSGLDSRTSHDQCES